jgi:hypothetical protein
MYNNLTSKSSKSSSKSHPKNDQKRIKIVSWRGPGGPLERSRVALGGARRPIPHQGRGNPFFGGLLGTVLGALGDRLGSSWACLRHLGGLWSLSGARLGACLGLSWAVLACLDLSWPVLTCLHLIFDRFLVALRPPRK